MVYLEDLKQIATQMDELTLSIFLDVDRAKQENQAAQPAWRIYLKNTIADSEAEMKADEVWEPIKTRVDAFFDDYQPDSKGLAAFFTTNSDRIYQLPVSVEPRWAFGKPLIAPLLRAQSSYQPYLIVMVDQEKAELISTYFGSMNVEDRLESDLGAYDFRQKTLMPASSAVAGGHELTQGSNREAYEKMIEAHIARFHREVVQHVTDLISADSSLHIVIGGSEQAAHAVYGLMPQPLRQSVVKVLPIPFHANKRDILDQVHAAADTYERDREMKLVNEVIDFAKSGGRGALGRKAVDNALTMQQVETLLCAWSSEDDREISGFSARTLGSGGSVELIHGAAAERLNEEGGIAALLRYTL